MKTKVNNDPCLECGTPTLGVLELENGNTMGIGINRLSYDDGERNGWLCAECAGFECYKCGKNIYLDEDITIEDTNGYQEKYHESCLTIEQRAMAIEQGELSE